jgi:hypothetical protein
MTTHHCQRCGKDWRCDQTACHLSHRSGCDDCSAKDGWKPEEIPPHSQHPLNLQAEEIPLGTR